MRISCFFISIFISVSFFSCLSEKREVKFLFLKEIDIDTKTSIDVGHLDGIKNYFWEPTILVAYSDVDYSMHFYDYLKEEEIEQREIDLSHLPEIRDFEFLNDSLFVVSTHFSTTYYVLDAKGKVVSEFEIKPKNIPTLKDIEYGNFNGGGEPVPIVNLQKKNKLLVYQIFRSTNPKLNKYSSFYILDYDLKSKSFVTNVEELPFSEIYKYDKKKLWRLFPRICNDKDYIYIGTDVNKDIFKYEDNGGIHKIELEGSAFEYKGDDYDVSRLNQIEYNVDFVLSSGKYEKIVFDSYRNLFYQVVSHPVKEKPTHSNLFYAWEDVKPFSIMVYDKNFKFITEIEFPEKMYGMNSILPVSEGLLINIGNQNNSNYSTSKISYHLYKITEG